MILGVPWNQNVALYYERSLRKIWGNKTIATLFRVTAQKCLGTTGLTEIRLVRVICIHSAK